MSYDHQRRHFGRIGTKEMGTVDGFDNSTAIGHGDCSFWVSGRRASMQIAAVVQRTLSAFELRSDDFEFEPGRTP